MGKKNILFVLHAEFEMPGCIETWARAQHFSYQFCCPFAGEKIPGVTEFDWLILMGGPQSAREQELFPYLREEVALIRKAIAADKVILGFCLGAQLIGEAFGAPAEKSPHKEIGIFPIHLTQEGICDPLLSKLPPIFPVVHWHNDMPGLSKESHVLAKSEGCPRQIVRYAEKIYGIQCHPECMRENIEELIRHCGSDLQGGEYVQDEEKLLNQDLSSINQTMFTLLNNVRDKIDVVNPSAFQQCATKVVAESFTARVWVHQDLSAIDDLLHKDVVIHSLLGDFYGRESMRRVVQTWLTGLPDLKVSTTAVVCEKDLAILHWSAKGTHLGSFKNINPTGKRVSYSGVSIYRVQDKKITEYWGYLDMKHLLDQLH